MLSQPLAQLLEPAPVETSNPPYEHKLAPFRALDQEESNWCWAATASMIYNFYTGSKLQPCEWASRRQEEPTDCCSNPLACNVPRKVGPALGPIFRPPVTEGFPGHQALEEEIREPNRRAVLWVQFITGGNDKGSVHFVPVYGIGLDAEGKRYIHWIEPIGGLARVSPLSAKIGYRRWHKTGWTKREGE